MNAFENARFSIYLCIVIQNKSVGNVIENHMNYIINF